MKKPRARWWGVVAGNIHRHRASSRPQNERSRRNSSWVMCAFASKPWWWDWCCYRQWSHYFFPLFWKAFVSLGSFFLCFSVLLSSCTKSLCACVRARVLTCTFEGCLAVLSDWIRIKIKTGQEHLYLTKMGCLLYQLPKPNCRLLETG